MAFTSSSGLSGISPGGPLQEPEGGAGDKNEDVPAVWQHLPLGLPEEVCARLPLAHMARAALASKSWASTYASCLDSRQQQLKALAPASAISAVQASLDAWEYVTEAAPDGTPFAMWDLTESIADQREDPYSFQDIRHDESNNYTAQLGPTGITAVWSSQCGARLSIMCDAVELVPRAYERRALLVMLNFELESAESLPWVVGLLLKLAQEVLPQKCGEQMGGEGGPRIVMKVQCSLDGETGWEDWAPLAPLCRAVRLTISPREFPLPWNFSKYAVIARSPRGWESPMGLLHISARWWEPVSCWSVGEGAGPHLSSSVSSDSLPDESAGGPHHAGPSILDQAHIPCRTHLGRIDEDDWPDYTEADDDFDEDDYDSGEDDYVDHYNSDGSHDWFVAEDWYEE